ncbi:hypothetical protein U9M48_034191 [Paspalum notatum var. saurae]|uniref:Uncharacterized protein n=1 Tax=Paspalum notatum var. saurae TaxID=547442 RepID=A0AAQ3X6W9_PASNO
MALQAFRGRPAPAPLLPFPTPALTGEEGRHQIDAPTVSMLSASVGHGRTAAFQIDVSFLFLSVEIPKTQGGRVQCSSDSCNFFLAAENDDAQGINLLAAMSVFLH